MPAHDSPASLLLAHFEKLVLGGFAGWLAFVGVGFAFSPAAVVEEEQLATSMQRIDLYMSLDQEAGVEAPEGTESLRLQLDPAQVPPAPAFADWVLHRRPQFLFDVEPPPPEHEIIHKPSSIDAVDASQRGRVVVRWSSGERSRFIALSFALERRVGDGPWAALGALQDGIEFTDEDVDPATSYAYRVVSSATLDEGDDLSPEVGEIPEDKLRVVGPASTATRTPLELGLSLNTADPGDAVQRIPATAQVFVHRWNPKRDRFDRKLVQVEVGEPIGAGRFATTATLERVWVDERPIRGTDKTRKVAFAEVRWEGRDEPQVLEMGAPFPPEGE